MAFMAGNLKSLLAVKIKTRHDSYTDQISRIAVTKMFLVASIVMGVDWFHDTVSCLPPLKSNLNDRFIHSSCWIKGFYVYSEMRDHMQSSSYYGIPKDLDSDGLWNSSEAGLCRTTQRLTVVDHSLKRGCIAMEKQFFTQYQWMPFCIASFSLLFYLPYLFFRVVNTDMISLRLNLKRAHVDAEDIVKNYFNHNINSVKKMRFRVGLNLVIKCMYVAVNVGVFLSLNAFLNYGYTKYGIDYIRWARQGKSLAWDFEKRTAPTPGNKILPTFGICILHDIRKDISTSFADKATMVCEISSNILYQYVFLVLWFVMVISMGCSVLGFVLAAGGHLHTLLCFTRSDNQSAKYVYRFLTLRECDYLEFIRRKDLPLYGDIIHQLKQCRCHHSKSDILEEANGLVPNFDGADGMAKLSLSPGISPGTSVGQVPQLMYRLQSIESNI